MSSNGSRLSRSNLFQSFFVEERGDWNYSDLLTRLFAVV
jgi:hypothetical protein